MKTIQQLLVAAALPRLEARLLLQQVTGLSHVQLIAAPERELDADSAARFASLAERRRAGEPIAYLLGSREFYGRDFAVSPAVLIPRPETEHLVEAALERAGRGRPVRVHDFGTGSGIIAVTLALEAPAWRVSASDLSAEALDVARANAAALGASVAFSQGSWYEALPDATERFDLIVSNPPYIAVGDHHLEEGDLRFEPGGALTDFDDGLSCLRALAEGAPARLVPGGWLMVEHGFDQGEAVRALFDAVGLTEVATLSDLAGLDRLTIGRKPI